MKETNGELKDFLLGSEMYKFLCSIEKGLISDPSKMKKQDLINLIETNDI